MKLYKVEYKYIDNLNKVQDIASVHVICESLSDVERYGKEALKRVFKELRTDYLHLHAVQLLEEDAYIEAKSELKGSSSVKEA